MFIPMGSGGGGGRPRDLLIILAGYIAVVAGVASLVVVPRFRTGVDVSRSVVKIDHKIENHPLMKEISFSGAECLVEKGYTVHTTTRNIRWATSLWGEAATVSREGISIDQVLADCKACGTATQIKYSYDVPVIGFVHREKTLPWHSAEMK